MYKKYNCNQYNRNLEQIKQAFTQYNFEINNLWQRSIFLFGFLVLIYTAYGNLQISYLKENSFKIYDNTFIHCLSFMICIIGAIFSILWILMAKGSKNIQNRYQTMIEYIKLKSPDLPYLAQLGEFKEFNIKNLLSENRYSPSKINIMIGWINLAIFTSFAGLHLCCIDKCASFFIITIIMLLYFGFAYFLRGNDNK